MKSIPIFLFLIVVPYAGIADEAADDKPAAPVFGDYEPNVAYPYGRANPAAPAELEQFAFMIGANECVDEIFNPDGTSSKFAARWNAHYFLNGFGIQDQYWTPQAFVTSNIRIFDPAAKTWKITFFSMPGYSSGVWEGGKEGDNMVMRQHRTAANGNQTESRLTFYNITDTSFDWKAETIGGESIVVGWTSSCKKAR